MTASECRSISALETNSTTEGESTAVLECRELARLPTTQIPCENENDCISALAKQLSKLSRAATVRLALEIGELISRTLLIDDIEFSGACVKHRQSFRQLAAHPDVPYSVGTLWRSVAIYHLSLRAPHLLSIPHLGVSHYRAVLHLCDSDKERLLLSASAGRWTKTQLELAAAQIVGGSARHDVGQHTREMTRAIRRIEGSMKTLLQKAKVAQPPSHSQADVYANHMRQLKTLCDELATALGTHAIKA